MRVFIGGKKREASQEIEGESAKNGIVAGVHGVEGNATDEITVLISTAEGRNLSILVSKGVVRLRSGGSIDDIDGVEVPARLRVELLEHDERYGLVALPGEPVEGSRVAKVSRSLLSANV